MKLPAHARSQLGDIERLQSMTTLLHIGSPVPWSRQTGVLVTVVYLTVALRGYCLCTKIKLPQAYYYRQAASGCTPLNHHQKDCWSKEKTIIEWLEICQRASKSCPVHPSVRGANKSCNIEGFSCCKVPVWGQANNINEEAYYIDMWIWRKIATRGLIFHRLVMKSPVHSYSIETASTIHIQDKFSGDAFLQSS